MQKEIIIHIGFPKAGSSFLQRKFFRFLDNVYTTGNKIKLAEDPLKDLKNSIHKTINLEKKFFTEEEIDEKKKILNAFLKTIKEEKIIFTAEAFTGLGYDTTDEIRKTLKIFFPDAKIFIIFRKQDGWVESVYRQFIDKGYFVDIDTFLNFEKGSFQDKKYNYPIEDTPNLDVNNLNWLEIIENYQKDFGTQNVLALPYELLNQSPKEFLERFFDFFGIKHYYPDVQKRVNKKNSYYFCQFNRFINKYTCTFIKGIPRIILRNIIKFLSNSFPSSNRSFLSQEKREKIRDMHKSSNKKLAEITGFDLGKYGYY